MRGPMVAALAGVFLLGAGCARMYTSVRQTPDENYVVTQVKQGLFKQSGSIYRCTLVGSVLTCVAAGEP